MFLPTMRLLIRQQILKLIGNIEYRFKLFWILEGATFIDVGNIWTFRKDDNRPNGEFKWPLIDDLAVGTGLGFRFDIKFVLLRADFGFKLRDPQAARRNEMETPHRRI